MRVGEILTDAPMHKGTHSAGDSVLETSQQRGIDGISADDAAMRVCRICLESGETDGLIHPCKCTGSVRYIHELCLKAWLASQNDDVAKAECELCKTPFDMHIELKRQCTPKEACNEGFTQCLFVPLLLAVLAMLVLIIYLLSEKYLVNGDSGEQRGYTAALVVTCIITAGVITYLLVRALREACCSRKLTEWKILNYEPRGGDDSMVSQSHGDSKVEPTEGASFPTRLDIRTDEDAADDVSHGMPPVLILPKRLRINGVKVKTPCIHSASLTPINQRGRTVAVAPRIFAFPGSLSQSRASPRAYYPNSTVRPVRWTPDRTIERRDLTAHTKSESLIHDAV